MSITITELQERDRPIWDAYVENSAHGLPTQLSGWHDVMSKTYGYETHYLMAAEGEKVVGVLPLLIVRSFLVGDSATSMPGGLCADSERAAAALIGRGGELARRAGAKRLVLRDTRRAWEGGLETYEQHVAIVKELDPDQEMLWKRLHKARRWGVRKARKNGLTVDLDHRGRLLGEFHEVFVRFTHQVGTPSFGLDLLERVIETFPDGFAIVIVRKDDQVLGGWFLLTTGVIAYLAWGVALREYLDLFPTYLGFWECIRNAAARGFRYLDLGRSPAGSGAADFKRRWGGEESAVYQQILPLNGHEAGSDVSARTQSDPKFQLFMRVWPKLPLPVVRFLGPRLRRHIPFA
jgi:FemAB-related protein (PEP-CTERM system-associated)